MPTLTSFQPLVLRARELRKAFLVMLLISVATYAYLLAQFPLGNHDGSRMRGLGLDQVRFGRWFSLAVYALTGFRQLPVLNALLAIVGYVTAGFLVCFLVESAAERKLPTAAYGFAGLLSALLPWSNWVFYYSWMAAMGPIAQLLAIGALALVVRGPTVRRAIIGGVLFCLSMATYQSTVDTAAVLFWFVAIFDVPLRAAGGNVKEALRRPLFLAASISLGAVLYKISLSILDAYGLLGGGYHFEFVRLEDLPVRALEVLGASFSHLLVAHPFFPVSLKLLLLLLTGVGLFDLSRRAFEIAQTAKDRILRVGTVLLGFGLMVFCTKIQFLVGLKPAYYDHRFASFGPTYVYLPFIIVALASSSGWKKLVFTAGSVLCVWSSIVSDLSWQDAHVKQVEFDKRFLNRVIARIESLPGFDYGKTYDVVHLGGIPNIRGEYYDYSGAVSPYHKFTIMKSISPHRTYAVLEPRLKIGKLLHLEDIIYKKPGTRTKRLMEHIERSRPWPDASSVAIVGSDLVLVLDEGDLGRIQRKWRRAQRKK